MILCYVCHIPLSSGWIVGFPPAPDSLKLGLCPQHDTAENRKIVESEWDRLLYSAISTVDSVTKQKKLYFEQIVTVFYNNGKLTSFHCVDCRQTPHQTLRLEQTTGLVTYIPIRFIRKYTIEPSFDQAASNQNDSTP